MFPNDFFDFVNWCSSSLGRYLLCLRITKSHKGRNSRINWQSISRTLIYKWGSDKEIYIFRRKQPFPSGTYGKLQCPCPSFQGQTSNKADGDRNKFHFYLIDSKRLETSKSNRGKDYCRLGCNLSKTCIKNYVPKFAQKRRNRSTEFFIFNLSSDVLKAKYSKGSFPDTTQLHYALFSHTEH